MGFGKSALFYQLLFCSSCSCTTRPPSCRRSTLWHRLLVQALRVVWCALPFLKLATLPSVIQTSTMRTVMKIRTLLVATTLLTAATSSAFAQSSPAPANQSGPSVSPSASPTDQGVGSESGNTKGVPTRGTMNATRLPRLRQARGRPMIACKRIRAMLRRAPASSRKNSLDGNPAGCVPAGLRQEGT